MKSLFKVHFINFFFYGYQNTGDLFCSPLLYFNDYFRKYNVILHQIESPRFFEIAKNDVVILGGGGILYDNWNAIINKILECCDNVIIWGAGTNSSDIKAYENHEIKIDYTKFRLVGVRDFRNNSNLRYTPCVSCMSPLIQEAKLIKPTERIGTMLSFGYKSSPKYANLDHFHNINEVFDFISKHDIIVTSSYHCSYWATLCGKKVIGISDGSTPKIINQKYAPQIITSTIFHNENELEKIIEKSVEHTEALGDCISETYKFFLEVKSIVESLAMTSFDNYSYFHDKMELASLASRFNSYHSRIEHLEKQLSEIEKKLKGD